MPLFCGIEAIGILDGNKVDKEGDNVGSLVGDKDGNKEGEIVGDIDE